MKAVFSKLRFRLPFLSKIEGANKAESTAAGIKLSQTTAFSGSSLLPNKNKGNALGINVTKNMPAIIKVNLIISTDIHP